MNKAQILKNTKTYVIEKMSGEGTGHDWFHVERVFKMAEHIAREESDANLFVVQMAALLHDIEDWKFNEDDTSEGTKIARDWMEHQTVDRDLIDHICESIKAVSYKGGANQNKPKTLEAKIVQDADRLDALGAIGIGRAFAYGGFKGREMYNPKIKPKKFTTLAAYKNNKGTTINHFYEKLFLVKDLMHTKTAVKIATKREKFMKEYLNMFYNEWEGKL